MCDYVESDCWYGGNIYDDPWAKSLYSFFIDCCPGPKEDQFGPKLKPVFDPFAKK